MITDHGAPFESWRMAFRSSTPALGRVSRMFSAFKLMRLYYYVGAARMVILAWALGSEGARSISWGGPHVMNRGDRREAIFEEGEDRERFLMALAHGKNSNDWAGLDRNCGAGPKDTPRRWRWRAVSARKRP
jgi:hypothetical protein